jgi:hypothetical protein
MASAAAVCSIGTTTLSLSEGRIREWPGGASVWDAKGWAVTALACGSERVAVGLAGPGAPKDKKGSIALLTRGPSGWIEQGEIETPGVPRKLILFRGRLAAILEGRREASLAMMDAAPGVKVQAVPLAGSGRARCRRVAEPGGGRNDCSGFSSRGRAHARDPGGAAPGGRCSDPSVRVAPSLLCRGKADRGILPERPASIWDLWVELSDGDGRVAAGS